MRAAILLLLLTSNAAIADSKPQAKIPAIHTIWTLPAPPVDKNGRHGYYNIDSRVAVTSDPGADVTMYWASEFQIVGSGGGGYIGLQDGARRPDGKIGKIAIFSIWNAVYSAPGAHALCKTFTGEGIGQSCRAAYDWVAGHTYRLRVWEISKDAWRGAVQDEHTGVEQVLGDITVPGAWELLGPVVDNFSEIFGENSGLRYAKCEDAPRTAAKFHAPTGNNLNVVAISGKGTINHGANCTNVVTTVAGDQKFSLQEINP